MLMMQDTSTDVMCYYDGGMGFSDYKGLFSPDNGYPYRNYYTFMMYDGLYKLENQVRVTNEERLLFAMAAKNGKKAELVLANPTGEEILVIPDLKGFTYTELQILRIDEENRYTLTGEELQKGCILLPPFGCAEIKLWDLE